MSIMIKENVLKYPWNESNLVNDELHHFMFVTDFGLPKISYKI